MIRLLILCALGASLLGAENRLKNPGFEKGDATPTGWRTSKEDGLVIARDSEVRAAGAASLRLISGAAGGNVNQPVTGLAGTTVRFQAQVKVGRKEGHLQLFALIFDPDWKVIRWEELQAINSADGWQAVGGTVAIPDQAGTVLFGLHASGPSQTWIDEASLTTLP